MSKFLRETVDPRFTNKAAKITNAEYDETLIDFHDDIDALTAQLALSAGGVLDGIQVVTSSPENWNEESPKVVCRTDDMAYSILISTDAVSVPGMKVTICDENGNANANNITITCEGGELINGSGSYVINTNWDNVTLMAIDDNGTPAMIVIGKGL